MRRASSGLVVGLALALALTGCGDDEPLTTPVTPSSVAPASSSPSPSPSPSALPSPSPSPSPLSAFEADPAVQGLRAYLEAVRVAVNAGDLQQPDLLARATAARAAIHQQIYGPDVGSFYPEYSSVVVRGVRTVSATRKVVTGCSLEDGYALDREGGAPTKPRQVVGGDFMMVLESGTWKVDDGTAATGLSCDGVTFPGAGP